MISKYGEIAPDAALLRGKDDLAHTINEEMKKNPAVSIKALSVNGNDLLALGIPPRALGEICSALLLSVIESPYLNQKDTLLKMAQSLAAKKENHV